MSLSTNTGKKHFPKISSAAEVTQLQVSRNSTHKFLLHDSCFKATLNIFLTITEGTHLNSSDWTKGKHANDVGHFSVPRRFFNSMRSERGALAVHKTLTAHRKQLETLTV